MSQNQRRTKMTLDDLINALPEQYCYVKVLGHGSYGHVVQCQRKDTEELVAVKFLHQSTEAEWEFGLLTALQGRGLDQHNIVRFLEGFETPFGKALVFECLDQTLLDYCNLQTHVSLSDVRAVVDQMATALECLQNCTLIYTDLKLDNIMVCNRTYRPLQLKLIDFGLAEFEQDVSQGEAFSNVSFRAPEVILGAPVTGAIDIWSLGVVAVNMLVKTDMLPCRSEYETLKVMVKLLEHPSSSLLKQGTKTTQFFKQKHGKWRIKTKKEFATDAGIVFSNIQTYFLEKYYSLKEMLKAEYKVQDHREAKELDLCIDLLLKMLEINPDKRITPAQIHQHPFITNVRLESPAAGVRMVEEAVFEEDQEAGVRTSAQSSPQVIMLKPATPENTTPYTDSEEEESVNSGPVSTPTTTRCSPGVYLVESSGTPIRPHTSAEVTEVPPAAAENTAPPTEDMQQSVSAQRRSEQDPALTGSAHLVQRQTRSQASPRVILVKPAAPENTTPFIDYFPEKESLAIGSSETTTTVEPLSTEVRSRPEDSPPPAAETADSSSGFLSQEKQKRKNCFRKMWSWLKKHLCCVAVKEE